MRVTNRLNRDWHFAEKDIGPVAAIVAEGTMVELPHEWNAAEGGYGRRGNGSGRFWYRKKLGNIERKEYERVWLKLPEAEANVQIWLNGHKLNVQSDKSGGLRVNLTESLGGENILVISVESRGDRVYLGRIEMKTDQQEALETRVQEILSRMTLEQKAAITSGDTMFETKAFPELGIPVMHLADGPNGLRKQTGVQDYLGTNDSNAAICYPGGCATGSSWDRELLKRLGRVLGEEAQAADVQVLLGPAVNIKRSPLCGRNFEYFSEDPLLTTELAAAYIDGLQEQGVGASIKHFAANNQEFHRHTSSSNMDERTMREIYLAAFEGAVQKTAPETVMCSYNRINGVHASENREYMTKVLREDWGFGGLVVSDWGAVHNRVHAIQAGTDLTMPVDTWNDHKLVDAVKDGSLSEEDLDKAVANILRTILGTAKLHREDARIDFAANHQIAREIEAECAVLLRNENGILPLSKSAKEGKAPGQRIAFIGAFAKEPRFRGGGSSKVHPWKVTGSLEAAADYADITFCEGYRLGGDVIDEELEAEAVRAAEEAQTAVIFAGLPTEFESEGFDRSHMRMPESQNHLIRAVCAVQPRTVVVLMNGSAVELPWAGEPAAILEMYLGGEAVGEAAVDVLFGDVNPGGRLAESFPMRLQDNPSYLYYLGDNDQVDYREGVFVGYRYYLSKEMPVRYPFGYGLSYTTFEYSHLQLDRTKMTAADELTVTVDVTNTGDRAGKEVVQLYVGVEDSDIRRPVRELRAFDKVELQPGETRTVSFTLGKRAFAYWDNLVHGWRVAGDEYRIQIGRSCEDIVLEAVVELEEELVSGRHDYSELTVIGDVAKCPKGAALLDELMPKVRAVMAAKGFARPGMQEAAGMSAKMVRRKGLYSQPMSLLKRFLPDMSEEDWEKIYEDLNA